MAYKGYINIVESEEEQTKCGFPVCCDPWQLSAFIFIRSNLIHASRKQSVLFSQERNNERRKDEQGTGASQQHAPKGGRLHVWTWPSVGGESSIKHWSLTYWSKVQPFENTHRASLASLTSPRHQLAFMSGEADSTPHSLLETVETDFTALQSLEV